MKPIEKSLTEYLKEYAENQPSECFLYTEKDCYTVKETYFAALNLARDFLNNGVKSGDFVALCGTRSVETTIIFYALQTMGAVAVLCDPHDPPKQFVQNSGVDIDMQHVIDFSDGIWSLDGVPFKIVKTQTCPTCFEWKVDVHAPAVVIFTSGSTGKSKGVLLSQFNYINHILNFSAVGGHVFGEDSSIQMLPLFHVFGLTQIMDGVINRCSVFFPKELTPDYVCACIEKYRFTRFGFVPSFAQALADVKMEKGYCTDSLKIGILAGAPSTREQFNYIQNTLGVALLPVYGQSECIGITGAGAWEDVDNRAGSVGKVLPMNELKITNEGEITVKSPSLFLGYVGEERVDREEFFHTGDLGYLDDKGFLHITGRLKDVIIRNGNNLSAAKIEEKLLSLPFVKQAAVVGINCPKYGEVPVAVIVLKYGYKYDEDGLKRVLTKIEMPKTVKIVDEIPLTSTGKTDKQKIKEMFL